MSLIVLEFNPLQTMQISDFVWWFFLLLILLAIIILSWHLIGTDHIRSDLGHQLWSESYLGEPTSELLNGVHLRCQLSHLQRFAGCDWTKGLDGVGQSTGNAWPCHYFNDRCFTRVWRRLSQSADLPSTSPCWKTWTWPSVTCLNFPPKN